MASYVELHPVDPQQRLVDKIVERLRAGGVIALPTDSGYAIACAMANKDGLDLIRAIRQVGEKHDFTLLCHDFAQLGHLAIVDNAQFRTVKALTPGPYTFILKGTKDVPRMTLNPKKHTIGVRIPDHKILQSIVGTMGEPLISSSLIMPGETDPMSEGWEVNDRLGYLLDVVVEGPVGESGPTTVINMSDGAPFVQREGAGDVSMFE